MAILQNYLTKNPCYTAGRTIEVKGLVLHSVGVPQPDPNVFLKNWDKSTYNAACVHGFIGEDDVYITLPSFETPGIAHRGWHSGKGTLGRANDSHLGFEMCEPKWIKYTGGATFTVSDLEKARNFVEKTTRNAVILFAKLCVFHGLNPLEDGVILSHAEAHKAGIASNHGDPAHLWRQLKMDYDMDKFRQDVYNVMKKFNEEDEEDMDLARFKQLWYEMRLDLQDNDAGSWSKEARDWAVKEGLIGGMSSEGFNGAWEDLLTREQLVMVLYRFAQMMGKA